MKPFTYTQKKWAMTACLLGALTFNLSMNQHDGGIASADFASQSGDLVEGKLTTTKGVVPVKYMKNGDEVLAIVPKMTEGKACDVCGKNYPLDISFDKTKNDIDILNVALLKRIAEETKVTKASAQIEENEEETEDKTQEDVRRERAEAALEKILKKCTPKKYQGASLLECRITAYTKVLKSKDGQELNERDALAFYRKNIESLIVKGIVGTRTQINQLRKKSRTIRTQEDYLDADQAAMDAQELRENTTVLLEDLLGGIPSKFENVRDRLMKLQTEILREEALEVQKTYVEARDTKDSALGLYLYQEGKARKVDLNDLITVMSKHTNRGLTNAFEAQQIDGPLMESYKDFYNTLTLAIEKGMDQNIYRFMDGYKSNQEGSVPGNPRLNGNGRGFGSTENQLPSNLAPQQGNNNGRQPVQEFQSRGSVQGGNQQPQGPQPQYQRPPQQPQGPQPVGSRPGRPTGRGY